MTCNGCRGHVEQTLSEVEGVTNASVNLEKAEATGRCHLYEGGLVRTSRPPAEAAMAADLAIHGRLYSGSAGVDAAMAGVPTIMLDREGWAVSPFYKMGVGRVVFTDWDSLWEACTDHWSTPGGVPGLGDWGEMLAEIDPFRDGRAAERMGTYLKWLIEGFREGSNRETVLADLPCSYSWPRKCRIIFRSTTE